MARPVVCRRIDLPLRGRILLSLFVIAAGSAWWSGDSDVRLAAALLGAPLLLDFLLKPRWLSRIAIAVPARRSIAGAPFLETIELELTATRTVRELLVREPSISRPSAPALVDRLVAGHKVRVELPSRSPSRGVQNMRSFELCTGWPLGLFYLRLRRSVAADLVTEPTRTRLLPHLLHAIATAEPSLHDVRSHDGGEFHALREHQLHEDARGVHALRSAALGTLVRTVTHGRLPRQAAIVLDLRSPPGKPRRGGSRTLENQLSRCAGLVEQLRGNGMTLHVWILGAKDQRHLVDDARPEQALFRQLADAMAEPHRPLSADALRELPPLTQCFWIPATGWLDEAACRALPQAIVLGAEAT